MKGNEKENVAATNNSHHTRQTLINPQSQQGNEALTPTDSGRERETGEENRGERERKTELKLE